jgi:hypothetical protein
MLAQYLDLTDEFYVNGIVSFEASNYDYAVVQIITSTTGDAINFNSTLDSGATQGISDGNIADSGNYISIVAENLANGNLVSTDGGVGGLFKFGVVGRYIQLLSQGDPTTVSKLLVMLTKIS